MIIIAIHPIHHICHRRKLRAGGKIFLEGPRPGTDPALLVGREFIAESGSTTVKIRDRSRDRRSRRISCKYSIGVGVDDKYLTRPRCLIHDGRGGGYRYDFLLYLRVRR